MAGEGASDQLAVSPRGEEGLGLEIFVARQPIFDRYRQVYGYELLFRSGATSAFISQSPDQASLKVLDNTFFVFGLDVLTGGKRAFVNFTRETLVKEYALGLPPESLVVQVPETVVPDDEVLAACRNLKRLGYAVALNLAALGDEPGPLEPLAEIVKVDFERASRAARRQIAHAFLARGIKVLADKVETEQDLAEAEKLGCAYSQGQFVSKPVMMASRTIPGFKLNYLLLLKEINAPQPEFDAIEQIVKREVSLSFKLLRYINSSAFGVRSRITSLQQALMMLGLKGIRQWASIAVLADLGQDQPSELVTMSVLRARMCESVAREAGLQDRTHDLFLTGLFSLIDTLLGVPLADLLELLPFPWDCGAALLGEENPVGVILEAVIAYERGDWLGMSERARQLGLDEQRLPALYLDAVRATNGVSQQAA